MSRASEAELIDSENLDPGFQCLAGHSKFRSGTLTRCQQEWDWLPAVPSRNYRRDDRTSVNPNRLTEKTAISDQSLVAILWIGRTR